jgi:predicted nucleic acid-binding protein
VVAGKSQKFHQMRIVVDTNIIFSALVNSNSAIMDIIAGLNQDIQFYASDYTHIELRNHHEKLKKASKLNGEELYIAQYELFKYIDFITLAVISENYWKEAEALVWDIDIDDVAFVALALYLQADLWTGDKVLYNGLKQKGFNQVLSTADLKYQLSE